MPDEKKTILDETRERLEIDNLDETSRKKLFNKFVEKGGEIIDPAKNKQPTGRVQPLNRASTTQTSSPRTSNNYSGSRQPTASSYRKDKKPEDNTSKIKKLPFIKRIRVWFQAYSAGVISFNGKIISDNFLFFIFKTVMPSLTEIDSLVYSILYPADEDKEVAEEKHKVIINAFKDLNDYELLERVRKFNNKEAYGNIIQNMSNMTLDLAYNRIDDFKAIFKPMFVIRYYVSKLNHALSNAFLAHNNVERLSKELIDARVTTFNKIIDMIYSRYYNKLLILISYVSQKELVSNVELNEFLRIADEDILGYYVLELKKEQRKKLIEQRNNKEDDSQLTVEEKRVQIRDNKIIAVGMAIIDKSVSFEKDLNEKDPFYNISIKDRIYRLKVLFDFLEREYGYVLISNKVKYAVIYEKQKKTDYQKIFNNSFASLGDIPIKLNEYANMVLDMQSVERDEKINFTQRSMIVSEKRSRISYISRNIQNSFISIITPIKESLDRLLLDKEERDRIIENPNDIIQIDQSYIKRKPRIQGYTVIKAITEAYYFVSALNYIVNSSNEIADINSNEEGSENKIKDSSALDEVDNFVSDIEKAKENIDALGTDETYDVDIESPEDKSKKENIVDNIDDINTEINIDDMLSDIDVNNGKKN